MVDCIFCDIVAGTAPAAKVYEDDRVLAFFTIGPVAEYHTLVIPKQHARDIFDVSPEDWQAVTAATQTIAKAYKAQLGITDIQIITSNGADAQQDVFHLHVHIVPRTKGDGQDVKWQEDRSITARFDALLANISIASKTP